MVDEQQAGVQELERRRKAPVKNPAWWGISLEDPVSVLRSRGPSEDLVRGVEPDEAL